MPYKAFEYLQNSRPKMMTAAQYPDNGQDGPCPNFTPETKIELSYWGIADAGAGVSKIADQLKIKQTIIDFGCASTCVDVTPLFQHYSGGVFNENHSDYSHTTINHAVIIVGWDDRKYAWLVRNSWGTGWGEKGYMWIGYDCNNIGYSTTWCVAK
jgi:cathepsin L